MSITHSKLPKGVFNYNLNDDEYELEGHYSNLIVEEIGNIFPDNNDLISCSVSSTCKSVIEILRPGMHVICNKNDLILVTKVNDKSIWYIPHYKIIGKISKKTNITDPNIKLADRIFTLDDIKF